MATLAGVPIADRASSYDLGIALLLQQECRCDEVVSPDTGWEVEVQSGSPYVVARGKAADVESGYASTAATVFAVTYEAVQKGLDLLCIIGKANMSIRDARNESLVWWREGQVQVLRAISMDRIGVKVTADLTVLDRFSNLKPPPSIPSPEYNECLRYFRLAQVTDDLFDAYRNLWLCFELLLSSQYPKQGREIDWLKDALTKAHASLDLTKGFNPTGTDVIQEIIDELYLNTRLPLFHATAHRTVFVPGSLQDREAVTQALRKLNRLILFLVEKWLTVRHPSGGMTSYAFDTSIKSVLSGSEILVSDNDALQDPAHKTLAEAGLKSAKPLATQHAPELSTPGRQFWLGKVDSTELRELEKISRFAMVVGDKPFSYHAVEAELTHEGIDRLEAQIGFYLENVGEPKYLFTA